MAVAVDIFPGVGVGEGQLVGGDADDVAVGCVELVAFVGELAGEVVVYVGETGGGVGFGAGVGGEGVEVEVVYQIGGYVEDGLVRIRQGSMSGNYFMLTY